MKSKSNFILSLIKSAVVGVIVSILLVLIFAFVLKFINLSNTTISIIDQVIKIISIFVAVINLVKASPYKILLKGGLVGALYSILTFIVFSAFQNSFNFSTSLIFNILLGAVAGMIVSIILNIFSRDKLVNN